MQREGTYHVRDADNLVAFVVGNIDRQDWMVFFWVCLVITARRTQFLVRGIVEVNSRKDQQNSFAG